MPRTEQQASRLFISCEDPLAGSKAPVLHAVHICPVRAAVGCGQPFCGVLSAWVLFPSSLFPQSCLSMTMSPGVSGILAKYLLLERMNSLSDFTAVLTGFQYVPQTFFSKSLPHPLTFLVEAVWSQLRYCYLLLFISSSRCCPWGRHHRKALPDCII